MQSTSTHVYEVYNNTIGLGSHQNIGLHTGARANVVVTYLLTNNNIIF